jgi:hypothetical protein
MRVDLPGVLKGFLCSADEFPVRLIVSAQTLTGASLDAGDPKGRVVEIIDRGGRGDAS